MASTRRTMPPSRSILAVSVLTVLTGCGDDGPSPSAALPLPAISWEGQHLRVASDRPDPLCGGTAPTMDRTLGALRERMGTQGAEPSLYYALAGDLSEYDTPCVAGQVGCVEDGVAYTELAPFDHELVHLAREAMSFSFPLIEEGAAEYWGDDAPLRPALSGSIMELVEAERPLPFAYYPRAGHFVAYLVHEHGGPAFDEVSRRTTLDSSPDDFRDAVAASYGMTLEQLVEDYEVNYPECPQPEYRAAFGECHGVDPVPLCTNGTGLVVQRRGSCEDDDVIGPRLERVWTTTPVNVEAAGTYGVMFTATMTEGVGLSIRGCGGGCPAEPFGPVVPFEGWFSAELEAGVHIIEVEWPEGSALEFEVRFRDCPA